MHRTPQVTGGCSHGNITGLVIGWNERKQCHLADFIAKARKYINLTVMEGFYCYAHCWYHVLILDCFQPITISLLHWGMNKMAAPINDWFLHDRPWISPWMKSISNELNIIIHVIASQSSGHCEFIGNWLWRYQQNENSASETRGRCIKTVVFIVIYGFVMSCKK